MDEYYPSFECPLPITDYKNILLGHGSGGKLMMDLIAKVFRPVLIPANIDALNDAASFEVNGTRLAITTDSFVVNPIFFPGGDIGALAINGTVNDLAVTGARPICLSAAFILEEGFPIEDLHRVVVSMRQACAEVGVPILTGDTKVVDRGKGDKVFITTTGIGVIDPEVVISCDRARPGDVLIISGTIGIHGIAIMSVREGLAFDTEVRSDTAPLHSLVTEMLEASSDIHAMRDPTRGGLSSALNEIAEASGIGMRLYEDQIPIGEEVRGACEILGLDPLYVANEGNLVASVGRDVAEKVLARMRQHPRGREAAIIGEVVEDHPGMVVMKTRIGGSRVVDMLAGEQLPRIC